MSASPKPGAAYRPELDGLRAIAVVPVIVFHADAALFPAGYLGVDVFFLISGYLITRILLADLAQQRWSISAFYARRAQRILPALLAVIALSLPAAILILPPDDLKFMGHSLAWLGGLGANIFFWRKLDYFGPAAEFQPFVHTWSLAVEEQFYLVYPLALALVWRVWPRRLPWLLWTLCLGTLGLTWWVGQRSPETAFYLLPFRAWELLAGALIAWSHLAIAAAPAMSARTVASRAWAAAAGLLLLGSLMAGPFGAPLGQQACTLLVVLGAGLVIAFATDHCIAGRCLASRPLVGIGLVSYSAYLWHQPLLALLRQADAPQLARHALAVLAATLALATLTWKFVEQPCRKPGPGSRSQVLATALCSLLAVWAGGYFIYRTDGLEAWRTNARYQQVVRSAVASPMRAACHTADANYLRPEHACQYHGAAVHWAAFGDSHMVEVAQALALHLRPSGQGLKHLTFSACFPDALDSPPPLSPCNRWTREALDHLVSQPDLRSVVVAYRLNSHIFGSQLGVYPRLPDAVSAADRAQRWSTLLSILRRLRAADKTVYLVLQSPELPRPIKTSLYWSGGALPVEGVDTAWWLQRQAFVHERLNQLPPGVRVIDPTPLFCDAARCWATNDTQALYFDADHLSMAGADRVAQAILRAAGQNPELRSRAR